MCCYCVYYSVGLVQEEVACFQKDVQVVFRTVVYSNNSLYRAAAWAVPQMQLCGECVGLSTTALPQLVRSQSIAVLKQGVAGGTSSFDAQVS